MRRAITLEGGAIARGTWLQRMPFLRRFASAQNIRLMGERLYLRTPEDGDFSAYAELRAKSRRFLEPWEPAWIDNALSREAFLRRLRRADQDRREDLAYGLFLMRRGDDRLLGGIGLSNVRRGVAQAATLGYWIGEEFPRQRLMTEALGVLLAYAFGPLCLHRIDAACLPTNEPSRRLLIASGFEEEGRARRYLKINGEWRDHLLYALLSDGARPKGR